MNCYEILSVNKNSTIEQIKANYKKLALKFHPDRNSSPDAENKFKEISAAYQILSDPIKKKTYDLSGNIDFQFIDPLIIFQNLFPSLPSEIFNISSSIINKLSDPEFDFYSLKNDNNIKNNLFSLTEQLISNVPPPITNLFNKFKVNFKNKKTKIEKSISEKLNKNNQPVSRDNNPKKEIINSKNMIMYYDNQNNICIDNSKLNIFHDIDIELDSLLNQEHIFTQVLVLRYCKCDSSTTECPICNGKGYYLLRQRFKFIPYIDQLSIKLSGEGHQINNLFGDIYININIKPHPKFKIINTFDLVTDLQVNLSDIYLGNTYYLDYFSKHIGIKITGGHNYNFLDNYINDLGLQQYNSDFRGKLFINFIILINEPKNTDNIELKNNIEIYKL